MKKIFFVLAIGTFSFASGQNRPWVKPIPPKPRIDSYKLPKTYSFNYTPQVLDNAKLLHTLPNGNKVYALPMDNMPCVVPDMSQYNTMATVNPKVPLYSIPNPAYPPPGKPMILSQEQLQKLLEENKVQFNFR
jgi:hypothetical protein